MSLLWLLALIVLLSPLLLALAIVGVVTVLAIQRVEPHDVPRVLSRLIRLLDPLAQRFPRFRDVRLPGDAGSPELDDDDAADEVV